MTLLSGHEDFLLHFASCFIQNSTWGYGEFLRQWVDTINDFGPGGNLLEDEMEEWFLYYHYSFLSFGLSFLFSKPQHSGGESGAFYSSQQDISTMYFRANNDSS